MHTADPGGCLLLLLLLLLLLHLLALFRPVQLLQPGQIACVKGERICAINAGALARTSHCGWRCQRGSACFTVVHKHGHSHRPALLLNDISPHRNGAFEFRQVQRLRCALRRHAGPRRSVSVGAARLVAAACAAACLPIVCTRCAAADTEARTAIIQGITERSARAQRGVGTRVIEGAVRACAVPLVATTATTATTATMISIVISSILAVVAVRVCRMAVQLCPCVAQARG